MSAILTLGGIGLGFGAAAVAGAVGLGIVAAAAAGRHRHQGHGGGGGGYGGGGGGYGGGGVGYGGGGGGHGGGGGGYGGGFNDHGGGGGGGHGGFDPDGYDSGYRKRRTTGNKDGLKPHYGSTLHQKVPMALDDRYILLNKGSITRDKGSMALDDRYSTQNDGSVPQYESTSRITRPRPMALNVRYSTLHDGSIAQHGLAPHNKVPMAVRDRSEVQQGSVPIDEGAATPNNELVTENEGSASRASGSVMLDKMLEGVRTQNRPVVLYNGHLEKENGSMSPGDRSPGQAGHLVGSNTEDNASSLDLHDESGTRYKRSVSHGKGSLFFADGPFEKDDKFVDFSDVYPDRRDESIIELSVPMIHGEGSDAGRPTIPNGSIGEDSKSLGHDQSSESLVLKSENNAHKDSRLMSPADRYPTIRDGSVDKGSGSLSHGEGLNNGHTITANGSVDEDSGSLGYHEELDDGHTTNLDESVDEDSRSLGRGEGLNDGHTTTTDGSIDEDSRSLGYDEGSTFVSPGSETLEEVLEGVRAQDVSGCGRRLVCELGGADPQTLTIEELTILDFIGAGVRPGEGFVPPGASWEYRAARGYGETGGDCAKAFPTCPLNGTQLMEVVNQYIK